MIYTITLNPALDHIIETNKLNVGETNYYQRDYTLIGGKGINVSIILKNLGANVTSSGILGSKNQNAFIDKFNEIGLQHHFFINDGITRTNFKIKDLSIRQETELNGVGSKVDSNVLKQLIQFLEDNLSSEDILIAAGSIPAGVDNNIYQQIGEIAKAKKALFILDTSKQNMLNGLKSNPFMIKPNIEEICEILNKEFRQYSFEEIKSMIKELQQLGARNVLFSMGSQGSYYFSEDKKIYKVGIATGKLVNSVGSGDSMIGGFAYAISQKNPIEIALKYGAAAGGATAFSEWLGTKSQIEKLVNTISVEQI